MATATSIEEELIARLVEAFPPGEDWEFNSLYMIHGYGISIGSNSSDGMHSLTRALRHVYVSKTERTDITIEIRSGRTSPVFQWMQDVFKDRVIRIQHDRYRFLYNPGVHGSIATFSFFDIQSRRAIYWIEDMERLPWYEIAAPFKTIFHWFFQQYDIVLIHGASIGTDAKGVLLIGKGGTGKSSTALTVFAGTGLRYVSDDYVLFAMNPTPTLISLYSSAKVTLQSLGRFSCFSNVSARMPRDGEEKAVIFPCESAGDTCAVSLPITAIALPVVSHRDHTVWEHMHSAHALLALAPSTIFQLHPEDTLYDSFGTLVRLVKQFPSYRILVGNDVKEIGRAMESFISTI